MMSILIQPFRAMLKDNFHKNSINELNYLRLIFIILSMPLMILFIFSCGQFDSGGGTVPLDQVYTQKIYSINSDGTNLKFLSNTLRFKLSITGDSIFYVNSGIYCMNLDGTNNHLITSFDPYILYFWLSADGKKICTGDYRSAHILNTDGSGLTKINFPDSIIDPQWALSPAGNLIAVSLARGLCLINPDGRNFKVLRDSSNLTTYYNLSFTSDGNSVLYIQDEHDNGRLNFKSFNLKTGKDINLFPDLYTEAIYSYEVSPEDSILFTDVSGISLLNLSNYTTTFLTKGFNAHFSPDGSNISYVITDVITDSTNLYIYNLKSGLINRIQANFPGNYILDPYLSHDNSKIIFLEDSPYLEKSN